MKFEYWQDPKTGKWNYHLIQSSNGEVLMFSNQSHSNKGDMLLIIDKINESRTKKFPVEDITEKRIK
jgi:hypothetical protein